jgi:hypothetical protein
MGGCSSTCGCVEQPSCQIKTTTAVAWTEQSHLGTPEQLFSSLAGSCQAPFHWSASAATVDPPQGVSTLTATVALDSSSVRLVTYTDTGMCPDALQVDGTVTLELPEGKIADQRPVTLGASAGTVISRLSFVLNDNDFGPWVSIRKSDPQTSFRMTIDMATINLGCSGEIQLGSSTPQGTNATFGAVGRLAAWP